MAPVRMRLLTYNILKGGHGREAEIVEVIRSVAPDMIVAQEVLEVDRFRRIATALGMSPYLAESRGRLPLRIGLLSRLPVLDFRTLELWPVWPSCLQATVQLANGSSLTVYGLHLAAYYPWFFERWRVHQVRVLLRYIRRTAPKHHLLTGDFNAIAPGDRASLAQAPLWVKAQAWFQLGYIPRWALGLLLGAGYVDCFRRLHPEEDGFTLPSPRPQVRLDYVFASPPLAKTLRECRVVTSPGEVASASDHLPILTEFRWGHSNPYHIAVDAAGISRGSSAPLRNRYAATLCGGFTPTDLRGPEPGENAFKAAGLALPPRGRSAPDERLKPLYAPRAGQRPPASVIGFR